MTPQEFDEILKQTLSDHRVSRGEKRALNSVIDEVRGDSQKLALLRSRAFELARQEVTDPESHAIISWLEDIAKILQPKEAETAGSSGRSEAYFSPGDECRSAIVSLLRRAKKTADICVFTITDNDIASEIRDAHRRGVKVRIITDNDKAEDLGSDVDRLDDSGVPVRVDQTPHHMHHKYAIFDGDALLTGSYNWTRSAASSNEENIIVTYDEDLVREFVREFGKLWDSLG